MGNVFYQNAQVKQYLLKMDALVILDLIMLMEIVFLVKIFVLDAMLMNVFLALKDTSL